MEWKEIGKTIIGGGAPLLGGLLGGPMGAKVGGIVAGLLGCAETPDGVHTALASSPEALVALRKFEMDNAVALQTLKLQELQAYLGDVASAREREKAIVASTGQADINLYVLAWTVVIGFFVLVGVLMFINLPGTNIGPVNQLFGAMAVGFGTVLSYFFGSSKSSADKTAMLGAK